MSVCGSGNHDVDRTRCVGLARTLGSRERLMPISAGEPLVHLTDAQGAFLEWHNEYFKKVTHRVISQQSTAARS